MPNLKLWTEAQLKRGYTKKQIKDLLKRRGYSPAAVAEVDKIAMYSIPKKQFGSGKNPKLPAFLVFALIILVIIAAIGIKLFSGSFSPDAEKGIKPVSIEPTASTEPIDSAAEARSQAAQSGNAIISPDIAPNQTPSEPEFAPVVPPLSPPIIEQQQPEENATS